MPNSLKCKIKHLCHNGTITERDRDRILKALEQEACDDAISRKSIKQKLQEHHDFYVNAYGGFSNLPPNDKSRVDEISNCIAMVVNEPPVTLQPFPKGHGRIIDESQVAGTFTWDNGYIECYAPTIIEADNGESEKE